jgi:hypothetical protein
MKQPGFREVEARCLPLYEKGMYMAVAAIILISLFLMTNFRNRDHAKGDQYGRFIYHIVNRHMVYMDRR